MRYIPNDSLDPAYNQAFEERALALPTQEDLLLVWRNRPSVICGRYQNVFQEVCVPEAQANGVEIVRRTTGGGCVYHDLGNVNYAFISNAEAGYDAPLARIVAALRSLGVPAQRQGAAVVVDGRKISGSAQRVDHGRLLHHGTLLYDVDLSTLRRLANGHSRRYQSRAIRSEPAPVTNIRAYVRDKSMTVEAFLREMTRALAPSDVWRPEMDAQTLAETKYRSWDWTFGQSPKFSYDREADFRGVPLCVSYEAERGVIWRIQWDCEALDCEALARATTDVRLDPEILRERLEREIYDRDEADRLCRCLF